jgi:hypothetical protein
MASFLFELICSCSTNEIKNFVKPCSIPPKMNNEQILLIKKKNFFTKEKII